MYSLYNQISAPEQTRIDFIVSSLTDDDKSVLSDYYQKYQVMGDSQLDLTRSIIIAITGSSCGVRVSDLSVESCDRIREEYKSYNQK